jgi:hypothetical protein
VISGIEASTMRSSDLTNVRWSKSRRSNGGGGGNCVEVARLSDQVAMRDSKDPDGPVLTFPRPEWHAFLDAIRSGEFD